MGDLQKRIVSIGKLKDTEEMISIMKGMATGGDPTSQSVADAKMAMTISATFLESFRSCNSLMELYTVSNDLVKRYESLSDIENVRFSLVKIQLALGLMDAALKSVESFPEPRLRMFTSILERCAEVKDSATAVRVRRLLPKFKLRVTEREVPLILRCGLPHEDLDEFLTDLRSEFEEPYPESVFDFSVLGSDAVSQSVDISPDGDSICPVTGLKLERVALTEPELDELISMTRSLATEAGFTTKMDFDELLRTQLSRLPDVVLDGANIAHVNQNFTDGYFRFDQIRDIQTDFQEKDCLIVLHSKWLSPDKDLRLFPVDGEHTSQTEPKRLKKRKKPALPPLGAQPIIPQELYPPEESERREKREIVRPVPLDLIDEWRNKHILFQVPHKLNDDWFWMHICCLAIKGGKSSLLLISNDLMRDHYWRMQHPRAFSKFVKNHVCKYTIKFGEDGINRYEYMYPPNHSINMHRHETVENGVRRVIWHIPYRTESSSIRWMIVRFIV